METVIPQHVHLVGSIGLDNVPDIFRTLGKALGRRLKRVPDGEVGGRRFWVSWQYPLFRANPFLAATETARPRTGFLELRIADGVDPKDIVFGELGYTREARASYLDFSRPRARRTAAGREVSSLPANAVCGGKFVLQRTDGARIEKAYERAMMAEVAALCEESRTMSSPSNGTSASRWCSGTARNSAGRTKRATSPRSRSWRDAAHLQRDSQPM